MVPEHVEGLLHPSFQFLFHQRHFEFGMQGQAIFARWDWRLALNQWRQVFAAGGGYAEAVLADEIVRHFFLVIGH